MEKVIGLLGAVCGLVMRVVDLITGKRKDWRAEMRCDLDK